ncbi:MAG: LLM class flavin-dependent oxidoreductase [Deltaproteobacteria bacterium]|nr:LLM class flavin-dependent oxidoreductase [Deltaproteobacteria bacterium]
MNIPSLVLYNSLAPGAIEQTVTYARLAEERGFRSVLVSESGSDALALAQHIASVTSRIQGRSLRVRRNGRSGLRHGHSPRMPEQDRHLRESWSVVCNALPHGD